MKEKVMLLLLFLFIMSVYELKTDIRVGGFFRDLIYKNIKIENNNLIDGFNNELLIENQKLKDELNIDYSLSDFEIINATIVQRNNAYWLDELVINKGSINGIERNMIVINNEGMIGKIISTSNNTSIVRLLTSDNNITQVSINNLNKIMISKNNKLMVLGINNNDQIKVGDKVFTSGLNDIYPKGIIIGTVSKINKENIGYSLEITNSSNTDDLRFVAVLKRKQV